MVLINALGCRLFSVDSLLLAVDGACGKSQAYLLFIEENQR